MKAFIETTRRERGAVMKRPTRLGDRRKFSAHEFETIVIQPDLFSQAAALLRNPFSPLATLPMRNTFSPLATLLTDEIAERNLERKSWLKFPVRRKGRDAKVLVVAAVLRAIRKSLDEIKPTNGDGDLCKYLVTERGISLELLDHRLRLTVEERTIRVSGVGITGHEHCPWVDELIVRHVFLELCAELINSPERLCV